MATSPSTRPGGFSFALGTRYREWAIANGAPLTWHEWLAHIVETERAFWSRAKTRTVQFMAGAASLLWGVSLLFEQKSGFLSSGFTMMRDQMPAPAWSAVFVTHSVCVLIARWWPVPIVRFQWCTSFYGFVIWSYYVLATTFSQERYVIGTSFEIIGVFMLGWSLRRAGNDLKHGGRDVDPG